MKYKVEIKSLGRFFNIPCTVVDNFLKDADGNFIKVLLFLFSYGNDEFSTEKIAQSCGLEEKDVVQAMEYWNKAGLIRAKTMESDFLGFQPVDDSHKINEKDLQKVNESIRRETAKKYKSSEIAEIITNDEQLRVFFNEIQVILGRGINYSDQLNFIEIYEDCGFSPAIILMISQYCVLIGKDNSAYIKTTAKDWFNKGIVSYDEIEQHIIKLHEYHSYENVVKRAFGITSKISKRMEEYIISWNTMGISQELLEYAYDICLEKTGKLSFAYIDKVLKNLNSKGIKTVKDAINENKKFAKKNNAPIEKEHTYDINEIDEFQKNFLLKHLKKD